MNKGKINGKNKELIKKSLRKQKGFEMSEFEME
jgi:hypothetical protein